MDNHILKLLTDGEDGRFDRRRLLQALGLSAAGAFAAGALPRAAAAFAASAAQAPAAAGKSFPVTTVNHIGLATANYAKSRDFYVDLFGMRVAWDDGTKCGLEFGSLTSPNGMYITQLAKSGDKPTVGHIAFGIPNFMSQKAAMKAELDRRGVKNVRPDGEVGWSCNDPAGYALNIWVPEKDKAMYPGAANTCEEAASEKCKAGLAAGLKNLSSAPKPSGKGFNATSFSHIVVTVPEADLTKERDFYRDLLGMKVIYEKPAPNPEIFLRFGPNTLYLRRTANQGDKPYCNHFAFVVDSYDQAKVEAELKRRGLDPKPDSKLAWTIADPDGMRLEVAGWGLPEHIANDCHGGNATCPGGARG